MGEKEITENKLNTEKGLYSLIPLDEFKALMSIDDREDKIARFTLVTSTLTIEQYCKRKFLCKKYFEKIIFYNDFFISLREYPVNEITAIFTMDKEQYFSSNGQILEPDFYQTHPECGTDTDIQYLVELFPALLKYLKPYAIKIIYIAGYKKEKIPADLSAACLELATWNMNRYRGKRIGMSGNIKGAGIQGEHFEMSMPENVKALIEPYKRKVI